jgi:hypothetical protein
MPRQPSDCDLNRLDLIENENLEEAVRTDTCYAMHEHIATFLHLGLDELDGRNKMHENIRIAIVID